MYVLYISPIVKYDNAYHCICSMYHVYCGYCVGIALLSYYWGSLLTMLTEWLKRGASCVKNCKSSSDLKHENTEQTMVAKMISERKFVSRPKFLPESGSLVYNAWDSGFKSHCLCICCYLQSLVPQWCSRSFGSNWIQSDIYILSGYCMMFFHDCLVLCIWMDAIQGVGSLNSLGLHVYMVYVKRFHFCGG